MTESTPTPKTPRAPTVPHGFDIMLGTAEDVAKAGELGAFAGLKTKRELEEEFTAWIAAQPGNLVADFLAHLKRRAQERLDGMGPKPAKAAQAPPSAEVAEHLAFLKGPGSQSSPRAALTPDGGIPIAGPKE